MKESVAVMVGRMLYEYRSLREWMARGRPFHSSHPDPLLVVDARGRMCHGEDHYVRADRDGAYPIRVYSTAIEAERGVNRGDIGTTVELGERGE